jgi:hypothetical protein
MPTLLNHPLEANVMKEGATCDDDDSITILLEENELIGIESSRTSVPGNNSALQQSPLSTRRCDKSVTFNDETICCSTSKPPSPPPPLSSSLNSKVRTSLTDITTLINIEDVTPSDKKANTGHLLSNSHLPTVSITYPYQDVNDLDWPNRDEYQRKHLDFVKRSILKYKTMHPGKLRDYRTMTPEEKSYEHQRVLTLLKRLGISNEPSSSPKNPQSQRNTAIPMSLTSPIQDPNKNILDETFSPAFTQSPCHTLAASCSSRLPQQRYEEIPMEHDQSSARADKSELLVSMNVDYADTLNLNKHETAGSIGHQENHEDTFEIPIENDRHSDSSMELVRRAGRLDSDDDASHETPEDQIIRKSSSKRLASISGKRGFDMQRKRLNDHDSYCEMDISNRLLRLSLTPPNASPPENLFVTSQSPINSYLDHPPHNDERKERESARFHGDDGCHIDWGRESDDRRSGCSVSMDSLATNTPPIRYRTGRNGGRSFREVPLNLSLKAGATFHLDKLAVKRTEQARSKRPGKTRGIEIKNRRLVSFPDPFTRYTSRIRSALKEVFSSIRTAEIEREQGLVDRPAMGVFFSLSDQNIIDVSLKLLLRDLSENRSNNRSRRDSEAILRGNTLVVLRSKDDTIAWQRAFREETGCSVSNHSTLPLSERTRPSSAEKACAHDVVLTTYDAIKSPDIAVPLTNEGHVVLEKINIKAEWHASRTPSQHNSSPQLTKPLSILHHIDFKRIIFVDNLGRKCFLAKGGTARASAAVALTGSTRIIFFQESESDGSDPLRALRKSDKRALESVSKVLRLPEDDEAEETSCDEERSSVRSPLEIIAMDFKDFC